MPRILRGYIAGHSSKSHDQTKKIWYYFNDKYHTAVGNVMASFAMTRWGERHVFLSPRLVSPFSRGMIFTRARVSLALSTRAPQPNPNLLSPPKKHKKWLGTSLTPHWQTLVSPLNANIICPFQKYNNTLELPSKTLHKHCFQLLLGPREQS